MNKRIAGAVAMVGSILLGPAALAAPDEPGSASGYGIESVVGDDIFDHGQNDQGDDDGKEDHDHDGDGRPDHDPEDHDEDDEDDAKDDKSKDDEDED